MSNATALDISQFSGEVTLAEFQKAKQAGVSRIVVALNNLPLAKQQIERASQAGLEVEAYIYLYFAKSISARVKACLLAIGSLPVRRIWLDAEDTSGGVTQAGILDGLRLAESLVTAAGYRTGIYTAGWFWRQHTGDSTAFKHLPLWDAYWDKDPDIDKPAYGGWTEAAMSQHTADTHFAGIWCDINSYVKEESVRPPLKLNEWVQKVYGPSTVPGRPPWNKHVRTEDLGNGYADDIYEMRVRRKVK